MLGGNVFGMLIVRMAVDWPLGNLVDFFLYLL